MEIFQTSLKDCITSTAFMMTHKDKQRKRMTRKIWFLQLSIYLCFLMFLTGCGGDVPDFREFRIDEFPVPPMEISETLNAHIYFDATLSMQGFVTTDSTDYTRILPYLERGILEGWVDGKIAFSRFGTKVERISYSPYFLKVGDPKFYEDRDINLETRIQAVIDDIETPGVTNNEQARTAAEDETVPIKVEAEIDTGKKVNRLDVIVTDLFQDKTDINLLFTKLKEKYIKNDLAVGMLGIRSYFDGKVYDLGPGRDPITHKSIREKPETFRPFYLLVIGRHADIEHYFNYFTAKDDLPKVKTVIFSQYLVNPLVSFEGVPNDSIDREHLNFYTSLDLDPRLKVFSIVKKPKHATITAKLKYTPLSHVMLFDAGNLANSVVATLRPEGSEEDRAEAQRCLEVKSKNEPGNQFTVEFILAPETLHNKNATYLYEVTLMPSSIDGYRIPDWCTAWDMNRAMEVTPDDPNNLGSKTLNLLHFVRGLSRITAQVHRPKIAIFNFCIII